ncbi:MAG: hypothetical protein V1809_12225 [Planctomycetota bacterium]
MRVTPGVTVALLAITLTPAVRGDVILLKNGNRIEGRIVREDTRKITVEVPQGIISFERREIKKIEREGDGNFALRRGETLRNRGEYLAAHRHYQSLMERLSGDEREKALAAWRETVREGGRRYLDAGKSLDAAELLEGGRAAFPDDTTIATLAAEAATAVRAIRGKLTEGDALLALARYEESRRVFETALETFPQEADALRAKIAQCHAGIGDTAIQTVPPDAEKALAAYDRAMALDRGSIGKIAPRWAWCRARLALPLVNAEKFPEARKYIAETLAVCPDDPNSIYLMGVCHMAAGEFPDAAARFARITGREIPPAPDLAAVTALRKSAESIIANLKLSFEPPSAPKPEASGDTDQELRTEHFVILHRNPAAAEEAKLVLEFEYRRLTSEIGGGWGPGEFPCTLRIHRDAEDYTRTTGQPAWSGGVSNIRFNKSGQGIFSIATYPKAAQFASSALPHELAHVLFANLVGPADRPDAPPVPRWIQEAVAIRGENEAKRNTLDNLLREGLARGGLMPLSELVMLETYPADKVNLYYAAAYRLGDYLIAEKGFPALAALARASRSEPLEPLLRKMGGWDDFAALETSWRAWLKGKLAR